MAWAVCSMSSPVHPGCAFVGFDPFPCRFAGSVSSTPLPAGHQCLPLTLLTLCPCVQATNLCLISRRLELLRPLLTSRSSVRYRPFRHKARSPQIRTHSFIAQLPDLRRLGLSHKSFAVSCPLASLGSAFYAVLVHRLAIYDPRLPIPHSVTLMQLRFTSFTVTSSREDLHLQECAHAGRTQKKGSC